MPHSWQLFLEEEREKELEALYERGIADTLNRTDAAIGSGVEGFDDQIIAETGAVSKQTSGTLMAGERIVEAIDAADRERALLRAYDEERAASAQPENIPLPAKNPIMAALDLGPEEYVLKTLEKVRATELFDALLVLPFEKVVSLFTYLNEWALRVSRPSIDKHCLYSSILSGMECRLGVPRHVLPA